MKKFLLATSALATLGGLGGTASAADLPIRAAPAYVPPPPQWTGGYVGVHVGVGRMNESATVAGTWGDISSPCGIYNGSCTHSATGVVGGVEIGYDWQNRNFVYGVAADWTWTDLKKKTTRSSGTSSYTHQAKIDWLASFRGRMGLAVDDTLVYVTGGVALGHLKSGINFAGPSAAYTYGQLNKTQVGWVMGGGVEHKINRNWSFKGEALYYDLGRSQANATHDTGTYVTTFHHEVLLVRLGLNYRW